MQLTLHATRPTLHGAARLVQAMPACSVKPDVLRPDIVGTRGSMYGHTTTAMYDNEYPPRRKNTVGSRRSSTQMAYIHKSRKCCIVVLTLTHVQNVESAVTGHVTPDDRFTYRFVSTAVGAVGLYNSIVASQQRSQTTFLESDSSKLR